MVAHRALLILLLGAPAVGGACTSPAATSVASTGVEVPGASAAKATAITWHAWGPDVFDEAKGSGKLILIDAGIEGCTACRHMHEDTYADPGVARRVNASFVAVSVDADQQPDLGARYERWGWPATIVLTAEGKQVAAIRGSRGPTAFGKILDDLIARRDDGSLTPSTTNRGPALDALDLAARCTRMVNRLDEVGDDTGWGGRVRPVEGSAVLYSWRRVHTRGETGRDARAMAATRGFAASIDPVWGGVFVARLPNGDIISEKRIVHQAHALSVFAVALQRTGDSRWRKAADDVLRYLDDWMTAEDGTFYSTQQDRAPRLPASMSASDYHALGDAERRAYGIPPIDHVTYTDQNAQVVQGLVRLYEATGDAVMLERAVRTATALLARKQGDYIRQKDGEDGAKDRRLRRRHLDSRRYLAPQAYLGLALIDLHRITGEQRWLDEARTLAEALAPLEDPKGGGYFGGEAHETAEAVGRFKPYLPNLTAARLFTWLAHLTGDTRFRDKAEAIVRWAGTKGTLRMRGPENIAVYGMALDELLSRPVTFRISGDEAATAPLKRAALAVYEPRKVIQRASPAASPAERAPVVAICGGGVCTNVTAADEVPAAVGLLSEKLTAALCATADTPVD